MKKKDGWLVDGWNFLTGLLSKRFGKKASLQSDMRSYSFAGEQGKVTHQKRLRFSFWRKRREQKRQAEQDGYRKVPPRRLRGIRQYMVLAGGIAVLLVLVVIGGATRLAGLLHGITFLQVHSLEVKGNTAISRARLRELSGVVEDRKSVV